MGGVQASAEVIREMKKGLSNTVSIVEETSAGIENAMRAATGWNDSQGEQYRQIMLEVARLIKEPISTLQESTISLEKLARALDDYNSVRF